MRMFCMTPYALTFALAAAPTLALAGPQTPVRNHTQASLNGSVEVPVLGTSPANHGPVIMDDKTLDTVVAGDWTNSDGAAYNGRSAVIQVARPASGGEALNALAPINNAGINPNS